MSLVERMLELTPLLSPQIQQTELGERQAPRMPGDKECVKRAPERASGIEKIEPSADRMIDRLVSPTETSSHKGTMYGLNEEEIRLLKGKSDT